MADAPRFVLRMDDICPSMRIDRLEMFAAALDGTPVKPLIAVVPSNANPGLLALGPERAGFWGEVRDLAARGWTVGQHGYRHTAETSDAGLLGINRKSEFAGLPFEAQRQRIADGQSKLASEGLETVHFVPPYHSFDDLTIAALVALGFASISDGYGLWPYRHGGLTLVPQLLSSFRTFGPGIYTVCLHPNDMTPERIVATIGAINRRQHLFLTYPEAVELRRAGLGAAATRKLTAGALRVARTARRSVVAGG